MKKILILGLVSLLMLTGCQGKESEASTSEEPTERNPVAAVALNEMEAITLKGDAVTGELFGGSKVTVLNLWGTFCGPCIDEMPELEKLSKAYDQKEVQVIGLITDPEEKEAAQEIINKVSVTYKNILANDQLNELIVNKFDYVPATIFVDSEGKVLEAFIPGSTDLEDFKSVVDEVLK